MGRSAEKSFQAQPHTRRKREEWALQIQQRTSQHAESSTHPGRVGNPKHWGA